jgi:hypothetical protein
LLPVPRLRLVVPGLRLPVPRLRLRLPVPRLRLLAEARLRLLARLTVALLTVALRARPGLARVLRARLLIGAADHEAGGEQRGDQAGGAKSNMMNHGDLLGTSSPPFPLPSRLRNHRGGTGHESDGRG